MTNPDQGSPVRRSPAARSGPHRIVNPAVSCFGPAAAAEIDRAVEALRQADEHLDAPLPRASLRGQGLLHLVLLAEICGGDPVTQADMLLDFRRANETDTVALRQAVTVQDFTRIAEFSHRIKGSSLMLGATLLAGICARIEAAGAARDAADLGGAMGSFEAELLRLNAYLDMFPNVKKKRA